MQKGIVIKSTGSWYTVKAEDDTIYQARITGKFRIEGLKLTNPVAVGDEVMFSKEQNAPSVSIKKILPRRNYVVRQSPRKKHSVHLLASNIDQAILVITIRDPNLKQGFIDRFLLMTEPYDIPVHIVFNKADIYKEEDIEIYHALEEIYEKIGYNTLLVSSLEKTGLEQLKEILKEKTSLVSGQSGVGKSTLINAIQPDLELKTKDISGYTGKGQHTTTFAELFELDFGGGIIDTPGIKTLSFNHLEVMDIAHNFKEIFLMSENCKYGDCTHRNEPRCSVKQAVESGEISELRYYNYVRLIEEVEEQNYWERHSDI